MARPRQSQRHRLTRYLDESGDPIHTELFDYESDPEERKNFARDPEYASTLAGLDRLLAAVQSWEA